MPRVSLHNFAVLSMNGDLRVEKRTKGLIAAYSRHIRSIADTTIR